MDMKRLRRLHRKENMRKELQVFETTNGDKVKTYEKRVWVKEHHYMPLKKWCVYRSAIWDYPTTPTGKAQKILNRK